MSNIILQHYTGELGELEKSSVKNIEKYAKQIGADYKLVIGQVFDKNLTTPIQKIYMLDKIWDEYDNVVMLDIDMFAPKNLNENIFDEQGIGLHEETQRMLHKRLCQTYPKISSKEYPYWGGAIYKLNKEDRKRLREPLSSDKSWIKNYNKRYHWGDEGIMHTLSVLSKYKPTHPYLNKKWCQCSFLPNPEKAGFIHVRTKVTPKGPKRTKIENLRSLQDKGIIE